MNSSIFAVRKVQLLFALLALCAMVLAPFAEVKAQTPEQGTITVEKEVVIDGVATTSVPYTDFSFLINGTGTTTFDASGSEDIFVATGTPVTITEVPVDGYVTTYSNCEDIVLAATTSTATCTITNTASSTGGGGDPVPGYLVINKVITGTTTANADDFSFDLDHVGTTDGDLSDVSFGVDGSVTYELYTGTYSVVENDPGADFEVSYSATSTGVNWALDDCNVMLVTPNATTTCTITNTATTTNGGGNGTTTPATGTLVVNKVVNGGDTATSSFSFLINGGATTTMEADGTTVISGLATGTYSVTEVPYANYTPTYSNCMNVDITENATTTCTITNTFNVGGEPLYVIDGYKWHDEDEDGVWDNGEPALQGWTIRASAPNEITRFDVTDSNGYYSVLVTEGTWTVSETMQNGWDQIFPAGAGTHSITFSTTSTSTADINFGNAQITSNGGGGGGGGGGNGVRVELTDDNDDDDDDNDSGGGRSDDDDDDDDDTGSGGGATTPTPTVLGEQTSVFPYGAPNTGFGGGELQKMDGAATLPLLGMVMVLLLGFGIARAAGDPYDEEVV